MFHHSFKPITHWLLPFLLQTFGFATISFAASEPLHKLEPLSVSQNQRFLVAGQNRQPEQPFFYLGDTAWELFHRLNREEAELYLKDRARKGFTVIQAVALAELDGLNTPNAYGHLPLLGNDPTKPDVKEGPENDYWDHVDFIVNTANRLGLRIGFLPTWGDKWNIVKGKGPEIFTPENAKVYGRWLGERYRNAGIIWVVGGDRSVDNDRHREIVRAMALGLREGDGGTHLITFHPKGGQGSMEIFPDEPWLNFHMRQNGHEVEFNPRYTTIGTEYQRTDIPTKPILDGEPVYEDHPVGFKAATFGHSISADVRRALYWDLFAGACGHTYGHHSIWQMWSSNFAPVNNPLMDWKSALQQPGSSQMQHAKKLLLSRPYFTRIPDDSILVDSPIPTAWPGTGRYHFCATRDSEGRYAMIYAPAGRSFRVHLNVIRKGLMNAWWFNPRDGSAHSIGEFPNQGEQVFTTPTHGEHLDWVLVLDDASQNYPAPGQKSLYPDES